ncbi:MAG: HAD-IA family hydrolase, partial [Candidatus Diapherotrites archaeon]|nr:HAD-IA family hydrolase [Candidatus Diapherotrites archaeon]
KERYHLGRTGQIGFKEFIQGIPEKLHFNHLKRSTLQKGAQKTLRLLSKRYPLYLASNHLPVFFEKELALLKVPKYFTAIYVSYKLKTHKPQKEFFEKILERSGVNPKEALFVDDTKPNLKTAKEFGMTTVWFNTQDNGKRNRVDFKADYEIKNLGELIGIFYHLEKKR